MFRLSSRRIDLAEYKTKDTLLSVVRARVSNVTPNKAETVYKCLCPFHEEKTPSMKFYFNRYLQGWGYKCFGCGTSGDVFTFLMRFERLEFWDAMLYVTKNFLPNSTVPDLRMHPKLPFPKPGQVDPYEDLPF